VSRIYISASWKRRETVRELADTLRAAGHEVYDFTDPKCRKRTPEIPPERFPEQFDPARHHYPTYLDRPEWRGAVEENAEALAWCDAIVLLLPCGIDATADWALGVGLGKRSCVVGHPVAGERSPVHLWADAMLDEPGQVLGWLAKEPTP
jgi:hypothetical protein